MTEKREKSQPTKAGQNGTGLAVRSNAGLASVFEELFRPFDEFFQPLMPSASSSPLPGQPGSRQPILDIQDRGDHFSLTAELPGFTKDQVQVKVGAGGIELSAEKTERQTKGKDGSRFTSSRSYYQYLSLPDQVNPEKIDGTMKNGILELKLPKRASKLKDAPRRLDLK
jgi:HSP20 family protein